MIEAKDLRIGNLFSYKDCIYKVQTISYLDADGKNINGYAPGKFPFNEMNPVPITEEKLLMLGFEDEYKSKYQKKFTLKDAAQFGYDWHIELGWNFRYYGKLIKCEFVHQLQNLCYDLGQELTLKETVA